MRLWAEILFLIFLQKGSCLEIVGGRKVARYARPYMALISSPEKICGGVLIHPKWVLTAAHCKVDLSTTVTLGSLSQTKPNKDTQKFYVLKWIPNKKFDPSTNDNDIQILELSGEARLDRSVNCMPLPKKIKNIKPGTVCETAGWGKTSYKDKYSSTFLMEVNVPIISNQKCKAMWKKRNLKITKNMLCTLVDKDGKDTCDGDSGGPLICNGDFNGVLSFGDEHCGTPGNASVYTRLTKEYINWIKAEIPCKIECMFN